MPIDITIGGIDGALSDLSALPALAEEAVRDAVDATGRETKGEASRVTRQKYAIAEQDLDPYITLRVGTTPQGGASVTLLARPLPLSVFRPTVKMQTFTLTSRAGRTYTRKLPTIYIKRFKAGAAKKLPGYFPMHQRSGGSLQSSDRAVRRIGAEREKLTGVRYYTFPKSFIAQIKPKLVEYVGKQGSLELRGAFRKYFKGQRVLRGPR